MYAYYVIVKTFCHFETDYYLKEAYAYSSA